MKVYFISTFPTNGCGVSEYSSNLINELKSQGLNIIPCKSNFLESKNPFNLFMYFYKMSYFIINTTKIIKSALILLLISISSYTFSQSESYILIKGKIKSENIGLSEVNIDIFDNSTKINTIKSESSGKFKFKLARSLFSNIR